MSSQIIAQEINNIGNLYLLSAGIFNLMFGIVGNISIILVFTSLKVFKGNQSAFYLIVESISNIGLLLSLYLPRILTYILGYDPILVSLNCCKIRAMIAQIFGLCSLFSVCFLSFDQYLSTHFQYYWRQMSTLNLAYMLILFALCFAMLHSTLFYIFSEIQVPMGCTVYNTVAKHYISFFYYPILTSTLPLIFTVATSLLAYRNVRRIVRRQVPVVRRRLDRQMTAMTLARVIVFVICGVPFICISSVQFNINTSEDNYMQLSIVTLVSAVLSSLLYTNFVISFYIFLMVSPRFRRQAKIVLLKRCWRLIKCQCEKRLTHVPKNQISPEIDQPSNSNYEPE